MIVLKQILVATDFSEPSDAALAYGRELARTFGARLTVLHACENIAARAYGADGFVFAEPELQREVEAAARTQIEALVTDEDREALHAETVILTANSTAASIVGFAGEINADLIVMGTH